MSADQADGLTPERDHRVREAIAMVASGGRPLPVAVNSEQALVLQRIAQQRMRMTNRARERERAQATTKSQQFRHSGTARSLDQAIAANPLLEAGRDYAAKHPVWIGLALGAGLAVGPRKLWRLAVWAAPLAWRVSQYAKVAQRVARSTRGGNR